MFTDRKTRLSASTQKLKLIYIASIVILIIGDPYHLAIINFCELSELNKGVKSY